ncbi:MAG: inorganic diphosphatase [Puniceicoccales bacterium]|nr:inorganic diphosphatase [Puniceicoccales bacterium]
MKNSDFWQILEQQIQKNGISIDRPKGKAHPRFPNLIYPIDYGYIPNTKSMDGEGIDILYGTAKKKEIVGLFCTFDEVKKDSEIKILYACNEEEIQMAMVMFSHPPMYALLIRR